MAWDAGSIESSLDVDTSPFRRGLDQAKQDARRFQQEKFSATVDADTTKAEGKLIRLEERIKRISGEDITPNVDVQGLARANAELSMLETRMQRMSGGRGGGAGGGGFLSRFAGANVPNPSAMALGIGAALPAAVPLAGLAAGVAGGALSATVSGGLGLGAFAAGAKASLTTITGDITKLNKLTGQYNAATTNKQRAAVLQKEQALWKSLDPAQRAAVKNVQHLDSAWASYKKKLEPQTFAVVADGSKIAATGLKYLLPTAQAVGDELDIMAKRAEHAFKAPFWKQFFGDFLPGEAARSVETLGTVLGHLGTGLANLTVQFAPLAHDLENALMGGSGKFEKWTQGSGPAKFVAWAEKNGPAAADALKSLGKGVKGLAEGFAPIGQLELKALTPVLNFLGKLGDEHPEVITAIGGALLTLGAGLKAINLAQGAAGILGKLTGGGGLGGGGGGGLGKGAAPVPVFVTNWQAGGGGVGGGAGTVAKDAEKIATGGVLASIAASAKSLAKIGGPAVASALATANIFANQEKLHNAGIGTRVLNAVGAAAVFGTQGGELGRHIPTIPYNPALANVPKADNKAYTNGGIVRMTAPSKQDIQDVKDAAGNLKTLNRYLAVNTGLDALNAAAAARAAAAAAKEGAAIKRAFSGIPSWVRAAEGAASSGGFVIGKNLVDGITIGIQQGGGKVALEMVSVVKGALHAGKTTAVITSPSKVTTYYGRMIAEGLAVGFGQAMPQVQALFAKHTAGALGKIRSLAQSRLDSARQQLSADQQNRSGLISSISSGMLGAADIGGAINAQGGTDSIGGFLGSVGGTESRLLTDLKKLKGKHLNPALLQQIASQPPTQALGLAESILLGNSGSVGSINRGYAADVKVANQIGAFVGGAVSAQQIAQDQALVRELRTLVDALKHQPDIVVKINDREIARANRSGSAKNARAHH